MYYLFIFFFRNDIAPCCASMIEFQIRVNFIKKIYFNILNQLCSNHSGTNFIL